MSQGLCHESCDDESNVPWHTIMECIRVDPANRHAQEEETDGFVYILMWSKEMFYCYRAPNAAPSRNSKTEIHKLDKRYCVEVCSRSTFENQKIRFQFSCREMVTDIVLL